MKKRLLIIILTVILGLSQFVFVPFKKVAALTGSDFNAGYIIDDSVFFNPNAMTTLQVQEFLNSKVPICDVNHAGSGTNQPPFTCLKDFQQDVPAKAADQYCGGAITAGRKSAAQIIYDVGIGCGVSQKSLIVLLQKEQALVTDTWPWDIQYRSATGYGCPDTAACDTAYYGFFNQVYNAARQFKRYTLDSGSFNFRAGITSNIQFNPNPSCGGSQVYLQNPATAALYNYTPYQPNASALANLYGSGDSCGAYGNRNFWRLFTDWFGTTKPAGKWLRQGSDGQVWLVVEGLMPDNSYARKKFKLTNWEIYKAYFLQYEPIVPVTDDYLAQYTDDGVLGTRVISRSYSQIQFVNNTYRYFIPDSATCDAWALDCFNTTLTKTIPGTEFLERLPGTAQPVPPLMQFGDTVYKMQAGMKLPIIDGQTLAALGYNWGNVLINTQVINAGQPLGPLQIGHQIVIQFTPSSPILIYDPNNFQFHKVADSNVFSAWGMKYYANLNPSASSFTTSPPTISSPDLSVWATDDSGHKYLVDNGRKIDVTGSTDIPTEVWQNTGKGLLPVLPNSINSSNIYVPENGKVYVLEGGQKRQVPTWDNFTGLGLDITRLLPLTAYSALQFNDGPFKLADNTIFSASTGVSMVNGVNSLHIPLYEYFSYFNINPANLITGQPNLETAYVNSGNLSVMVKDAQGNKFLMQNGTRINIDSSAISNWGLGSVSFLQINNANLARLPVVNNLGRFIYTKTAGLFYGSGGQKHHIDTYSTYQALGGNTSNTFTVADEFLNTLQAGNPLP